MDDQIRLDQITDLDNVLFLPADQRMDKITEPFTFDRRIRATIGNIDTDGTADLLGHNDPMFRHEQVVTAAGFICPLLADQLVLGLSWVFAEDDVGETVIGNFSIPRGDRLEFSPVTIFWDTSDEKIRHLIADFIYRFPVCHRPAA